MGVDARVGVGRSRPLCLESESELELVKLADSDSGPESQGTNRQKTMILVEQLCIVLKTLKDWKKRRVATRRSD